MTNREYLKSRGVIPPAIISLLQPLFDFDLRLAKVRVPAKWKYPGATYMVATNATIWISDAYRMRAHELAFFQRLGHELWHVREYLRLGWLRYKARSLRDWMRARKEPDHWEYGCQEERDAYAKEHEVYDHLSQVGGWDGLMNKEAK